MSGVILVSCAQLTVILVVYQLPLVYAFTMSVMMAQFKLSA